LKISLIDYKIFDIENSSTIAECKGNNKKHLFINIVEKPGVEITLDFVTKVLSAVHHDLNEDCVVLVQTAPYFFKDILQEYNCTKAIFFGQRPTNIGLNIDTKFYAPMHLLGCELLFAYPLSMIEQDSTQKKLLWDAMKIMFEVE
jgi:hypothetical protein